MSDGYIIEAALARGFMPIDDEAEVFSCTEEQLLAFAREPLAEIERLREALRAIADGDTPREHAIIYRSDGVHSKHDKCKHGAWMYDGCEDCVADFARAALGEGK